MAAGSSCPGRKREKNEPGNYDVGLYGRSGNTKRSAKVDTGSPEESPFWWVANSESHHGRSEEDNRRNGVGIIVPRIPKLAETKEENHGVG